MGIEREREQIIASLFKIAYDLKMFKMLYK